MTMQTNNPLAQIGVLLASGKRPDQIIRILAQNNPEAQQAMKIMQGKSPAELRTTVENMCRERGTTPEILARSLGLQIPSTR